jgi:hypothetical protein
VVESEFVGRMLKHPLVFSMMLTPMEYGLLNKQYEAKLKARDEAFDKNKWGSYVFLHERPYRLRAFAEAADFMSDREYWELLSSIWTDTENLWQNQEEWAKLLAEPREGRRKYFMDAEERRKFKALPEQITVFRGYTTSHEDGHLGHSWTLSRTRAEWFARRFLHREGEEPRLAIGHVRKRDVVGLLEGRAEQELVIADPSKVRGVRCQSVD